ncbi:MAG: toll/interleukin-1 receptor domain-containing protein [Anaerolineae bacterium]
MNNLGRLSLVDRIGRELQARMTYADIDVYLQAHGVDVTKPTSGVNSKWVYTKELLADVPDDVILRIADELEIPHEYAVMPDSHAVEATFWEQHHFRLFISHLSSSKKKIAALQSTLRHYGISAFVAHVDIEPTKEWQDEIEAGLASMDALAAVLVPGFKESNWTDQEVGYALGRGVLIVPIIRGLNPYGFIGKYQGFHANGKTVAEVAHEVFRILVASPKTRGRILTCLVDATLQSVNEAEALKKLEHLAEIEDLPDAYLERLREGAATSTVFAGGAALDSLNDLLVSRGLTKVTGEETGGFDLDNEIPF